MSGLGGGIVPASRVLRRRRAAVEDMGGDVDAFWAAAPRLYDFSQQQQQQPQPPHPPPPPAAWRLRSPEPRSCSPCLLTLQPQQPSPPAAAAQRSPSPSPEPKPCGPCLLTLLQRTCVGWGARRRVTYFGRHQPVCGGAAPPHAVVEEMERRSAVRSGVGDEESSSGGAKKRKRPEELGAEAVAEESGREDKPVVVKAAKMRNSRKRAWGGRGRRHDSARRAKKVPQVMKEEQQEAAAAEESSQDVKPAVLKTEKTRNRKRAGSARGRRRDAAKRAKKIPLKREVMVEKESKPAALAPEPGSPRGKVDRWAARRYAAGEAALLDILRARGASAGKPSPRAELRAEARRHIGDTGLLDHLLRHAADKVPAGSAERIRRRYNGAGGLEYWFEPAELAAVRREAGVDDPYWVPPPGWKPGDPVSQEACALEAKKQVEALAGELAVVKREMKQLSSNLVQVSKEAYISWQGYDCMLKANGKLEKEVLSLEEKYENATQVNGELKEVLLLLKEKYETVLEKNDRLEEQMVALSTSFQAIKEDLLLQRTGEQPMLMLEQADLFVQEPREAEKQEASAGNALGNAATGAGNQLANADAVDGSASSNGGAGGKWASRKCSVRICRRDGTFRCPRAASGGAAEEMPEPLTPGGGLVVAGFDAVIDSLAPSYGEEYLAVGGLPTPTSASSTNASSAKLPLLPALVSPVQVQPPPPPPSTTVARDDDLQAVQPRSGGLDLQLLHTDTSSSSSAPCGAKALKLDASAAGSNVGTELALATRSY